MPAHNVSRDTVLAEHLQVAASLFGRFRGLMGRSSLPEGHGLFIDGTNGIHMFFMRFPIDAVFVGKPSRGAGAGGSADEGAAAEAGGADGEPGERVVVSVHRNVRPWIGMVPLVRGAAGVLELPVGTIDSSGTAPGDRVRLG